jgi:hypothetical protein
VASLSKDTSWLLVALYSADAATSAALLAVKETVIYNSESFLFEVKPSLPFFFKKGKQSHQCQQKEKKLWN